MSLNIILPAMKAFPITLALFAALTSAGAQGLLSSQRVDSTDVSGCGKPHVPGYHYRNSNTNFSITSGDKERYYAVQVPDSYNSNRQHPLIFDYHGHSDTSTEQRDNSMYYNRTGGEHYLVVYPQGINRAWEGPSYAAEGVNAGHLDLNFTTDLLAHINAEYCVDSSRVYASGKSNGGGFVDTLACSDNGDAFAAFAMASAALYTDLNRTSCDKKRAILESHGDKDTVIHYTARTNKGGPLPNVGDWVKWWGERNCGIAAKAETTGDLGGYNITSYSCAGFENVTQHYHFSQLGHCWPNGFGNNYDALHLRTQHCREVRVVDYTPVVLNFFSKWTLSNAPNST